MGTEQLNRLVERKQAARSLLQRGLLQEALEACKRLCHDYNTDPESHYMLGSVYALLGKFEAAILNFSDCIRLQPGAFVAHCGMGAALRETGRFEEAEQAFRAALKLQPENPDITLELAICLLRQDNLEESEVLFQRVLTSRPESPEALLGLGEIRHATRRYEEAIDFYQRTLKIAPDRAGTYNRTGHALFMLGRCDEAIHYFNDAVRIRPDFAEAYSNMGSALMSAGQPEKARQAFSRALAIRPGYTDAQVSEIHLLEHEGDLAGACKLLDQLLQQDIEHPGLAATFLNLSRHLNRCEEAIEYTERLLLRNQLPASTELMIQFALGKLHNRLGNYDKAFLHYQRGNDLKPHNYNETEIIATADSLIKVFNWQFVSTAPRATVRSERPVFIVGMPRSGTSLTEQILASHPRISGGGELTDVSNMVAELPALVGERPIYPYNLSKVTSAILDNFANNHLNHLAELDPNAARVTDKMPQNFLHLGLIALTFPDARIIHCVRDPRDICLSIYFQNFNEAHSYANRLEDIGSYYRQYKKLMQHYQGILDMAIMEVSYENLVSDQEKVSRQLIEFCGLDWDDRCLEFSNARRFVATSSYDQVRENIYSSSIGRWKLYEKHIEPLLDSL